MKGYGLIGFPLGHSASAEFFNAKFDAEQIDARYDLFPMANLEGLRGLVEQNPELVGLNVTIPHKVSVLRLLDEIAHQAIDVGAVNTIKIERRPLGVIKLVGYNTDIVGFDHSITPLLKRLNDNEDSSPLKALVLGSGGAARAVSYILNRLDIHVSIVSRTPCPESLTYSDLSTHQMATHRIIINTSPVGMYPNMDDCPPIPYRLLTPRHLCFDLIYNPSVTKFLSLSADYGATTCGGMQMFTNQALEAYRIWTSRSNICKDTRDRNTLVQAYTKTKNRQ